MKNFTSILIALILILSLAVTLISDRLSARYVELQAQPKSAFDMAMESRATPPAEAGNSSAFVFGFATVAGFVIVLGGAVFVMRDGGEFLRQLRLNRKRKQRRQARPSLATSNPQSPGLSEVPTVQRLRALPPFAERSFEEGHYQE